LTVDARLPHRPSPQPSTPISVVASVSRTGAAGSHQPSGRTRSRTAAIDEP
jgi:hypothetical protein